MLTQGTANLIELRTQDGASDRILNCKTGDVIRVSSWLEVVVRFILSVLVIFGVVSSAHAESSIDSFLKQEKAERAQADVLNEEIKAFEQILTGSDLDQALRAMRFMLASGKPALFEHAKQFGLYSAHPAFRREALGATLNNTGRVRMEVDLSDPAANRSKLPKYLLSSGGSLGDDKTKLNYVFFSGNYYDDDQCWKSRKTSSYCTFIIVDDFVSLRGWQYLRGNLSLGSDGNLWGTARHTSDDPETQIPIKIYLVE